MKVGRNDPCPCGSGKKYKQCCLTQEREIPLRHKLVFAGVGIALAAAIAAMALTITNREPRAPGERVWSEEHQHWHEVP